MGRGGRAWRGKTDGTGEITDALRLNPKGKEAHHARTYDRTNETAGRKPSSQSIRRRSTRRYAPPSIPFPPGPLGDGALSPDQRVGALPAGHQPARPPARRYPADPRRPPLPRSWCTSPWRSPRSPPSSSSWGGQRETPGLATVGSTSGCPRFFTRSIWSPNRWM